MATIQELAADFSSRFEGATRDDGTKYRRVKDGPEDRRTAGYSSFERHTTSCEHAS
jgi:hypothetical protein